MSRNNCGEIADYISNFIQHKRDFPLQQAQCTAAAWIRRICATNSAALPPSMAGENAALARLSATD
jgi:hypothetical protein